MELLFRSTGSHSAAPDEQQPPLDMKSSGSFLGPTQSETPGRPSDNDAPGTTALEFKGRIYKGVALKSKFSFFSFFPFPMLPGNEDKNKA